MLPTIRNARWFLSIAFVLQAVFLAEAAESVGPREAETVAECVLTSGNLTLAKIPLGTRLRVISTDEEKASVVYMIGKTSLRGSVPIEAIGQSTVVELSDPQAAAKAEKRIAASKKESAVEAADEKPSPVVAKRESPAFPRTDGVYRQRWRTGLVNHPNADVYDYLVFKGGRVYDITGGFTHDGKYYIEHPDPSGMGFYQRQNPLEKQPADIRKWLSDSKESPPLNAKYKTSGDAVTATIATPPTQFVPGYSLTYQCEETPTGLRARVTRRERRGVVSANIIDYEFYAYGATEELPADALLADKEEEEAPEPLTPRQLAAAKRKLDEAIRSCKFGPNEAAVKYLRERGAEAVVPLLKVCYSRPNNLVLYQKTIVQLDPDLFIPVLQQIEASASSASQGIMLQNAYAAASGGGARVPGGDGSVRLVPHMSASDFNRVLVYTRMLREELVKVRKQRQKE